MTFWYPASVCLLLAGYLEKLSTDFNQIKCNDRSSAKDQLKDFFELIRIQHGEIGIFRLPFVGGVTITHSNPNPALRGGITYLKLGVQMPGER